MTRAERQRKRQIIRRVCAGICALLFLLVCILLLTGGTTEAAVQETPETEEVVEVTPEVIEEQEAIDPLKADKEALARMVWGEARGCSATEQAAVVWCALNRFESSDPYYANCMTIHDIVTQPAQFVGYDPENPLEADILALVDDVVERWLAEKSGAEDVGRVLPAEYLYFTGDGEHNYFRDQFQGGNIWNWGLESPYEE